MKKNALIITTLLSGIFAFSQVGINTANPQQVFHIDGAKDNPATGAPSATQAANDFVVTSTGKVGIGITNPNAKLDVRTNSTSISDPGEGMIGVGTSALALAPNIAGAGAVRYSNSGGGNLQYSNGITWNTLTSTVQKSLVTGFFTPGVTYAGGVFSLSCTEEIDVNNNFTSNTFTAPRTGIYLISANLLTTSRAWVFGEELTLTFFGISSGYFSPAGSASSYGGPVLSAAIRLTAGQVVNFTGWKGNNTSFTTHDSGFNRFSLVEL
ncbi:hypothetical protein [Chryseobacterium sp. SL1]|uniref:hypothetical protein n=1 Tax=Chryseobacterium sp. SL1 TaxID=2995159 RepID=UPI0022762BB1|nr:hypothetical protein [Chryseobacterium sp. SL1]MCY1660198.1 hypothetical protein [Chryseobacterium sp. SL1]